MTAPNPSALLLYNPDLIAKDDLVRGFVARHALFERFLDDIRRESTGSAPQHHLIIGQRGTGKTTLLRRIAYAIADDPRLSAIWQPVIFPEEQYNITDLSSFWLNCVNALSDMLTFQGNMQAADALEHAAQMLPKVPAERRLASLALLTDASARFGKRLLLLVDNIDLILDRIGNEQEWELRRVLQEQKCLLVVGASSRALEQAYEHGRAFYDFFRIHELSGLNEEETLAVLRTLARQHAAEPLLKQLDENPSRVRVLRLLSGGNLRTIAILFKVLAQNPDGEVETDLEQLLDQYTPLYKERVQDLPPQAQVLVDAIATNWDPITAGDLAAQVGISVNAVSSQLQRLENLGMVEKAPWFGEKKTAFQIAERFFNIWYLMRGSRRARRRLIGIVKFLKVWFDELAEGEGSARSGLAFCPNDAAQTATLALTLVTQGAWVQARPQVENWARLTATGQEGLALMRELVTTGRTKETLSILEGVDARERLRPLYEALRALDAGSANYLNRVAPEVRVPAKAILSQLSPSIAGA